MRFYAREVAGWCLLVLGLAVFYACYALLAEGHIVEAGALTFIGFIVFRGGIHLLKVAVAARVCTEVQEKLGDKQAPAVDKGPPRIAPVVASQRRG